jgi:hypothetical protein
MHPKRALRRSLMPDRRTDRSGHHGMARRRNGRVEILSFRLRRRSNDTVHQGLGYSKTAGYSCRLEARTERGPNEICFPFGNFLNGIGLFAERHRLGPLGRSSVAGTGLGNALITAIDLDGNRLAEASEFHVVEVPQRSREVGWQCDAWRSRRFG